MALAQWLCILGTAAAAVALVLSGNLLTAERAPALAIARGFFVLAAATLGAGLLLTLSTAFPRIAAVSVGTAILLAGGLLLVAASRTRRADGGRRPARRPTPRRTVLLLASAAVAGPVLLAASAFTGFGDSESPVPPAGTVIDATTGQEVSRVLARSTPQFVQVGGGSIFRACDLIRDSPCGYNEPGRPVRVHIGDVVEFSTRLFNPDNHQVPYLEMYVSSYSSSAGPGDWLAPALSWRTGFAAHSRTSIAGDPVEIIFPRRARLTDLTYLPGSTVLFGARGEVLARLPDGIMEGGIALVNVGAPASCSYCETEYTRYVNFKVRVTNDGQPEKGRVGEA